jgi:hypothetical protein
MKIASATKSGASTSCGARRQRFLMKDVDDRLALLDQNFNEVFSQLFDLSLHFSDLPSQHSGEF